MVAFGNPAFGRLGDIGWLLKRWQVWGRVGPAAKLSFSLEITAAIYAHLAATACHSRRGNGLDCRLYTRHVGRDLAGWRGRITPFRPEDLPSFAVFPNRLNCL